MSKQPLQRACGLYRRQLAVKCLSGRAFVYIVNASARAVARGPQKLWLKTLDLSSHGADASTAGVTIQWASSIQTLEVLIVGSCSSLSARTSDFAVVLPSISDIPDSIGMLPQPAAQPALFHSASAFQQEHIHFLAASSKFMGFVPQPSTQSPARNNFSFQQKQIASLTNTLGFKRTMLPQPGSWSPLVHRSTLFQHEWCISLTLVLPQASCAFALVHRLFIWADD